jgi:hypothetical protein
MQFSFWRIIKRVGCKLKKINTDRYNMTGCYDTVAFSKNGEKTFTTPEQV